MSNHLVVIGWPGIKKAYLNVSREEAIRRFKASDGMDYSEDLECYVTEFEFDDQFGCYDAWRDNE